MAGIMSNHADDDYIEFLPLEEKTAEDPLFQTSSVECFTFLPPLGYDRNLEETTAFLPESVAVESRFQVLFSMLMDVDPVILIIHCRGNIGVTDFLVLDNIFKVCKAKNFPFVIVDLTNTLSVEKQVWEYFSSKASYFQKLKGILIFAGTNTDVLSKTTAFQKLNICHCQTLETACIVIRNLIADNEKVICFPQKSSHKQSIDVVEYVNSNNLNIIDESTELKINGIKIDESMSTNFSIMKEDPIERPIYIDDSMSTDFSIIKEESIKVPMNMDHSVSEDFFIRKKGSFKGTVNIVNSVGADFSIVKRGKIKETVILDDIVNTTDSINADVPADEVSSSATEHLPSSSSFSNEKLSNHTEDTTANRTTPDPDQFLNSNENTFPEMIHKIISKFGPSSFGAIKKRLHSDFGSVKINSINLYILLKSMNLESIKKRTRYYRSC